MQKGKQRNTQNLIAKTDQSKHDFVKQTNKVKTNKETNKQIFVYIFEGGNQPFKDMIPRVSRGYYIQGPTDDTYRTVRGCCEESLLPAVV